MDEHLYTVREKKKEDRFVYFMKKLVTSLKSALHSKLHNISFFFLFLRERRYHNYGSGVNTNIKVVITFIQFWTL